MNRTSANTDVEKTFDYKCRRKHSPVFLCLFSYTNQISSPSSAKTNLKKYGRIFRDVSLSMFLPVLAVKNGLLPHASSKGAKQLP